MELKNLIGKQVSHKKFGLGLIVEISLDAYVSIDFNGCTKKFAANTLDLFVTFQDQSFESALIERNKQARLEAKVLEDKLKAEKQATILKQKEEELRLKKEAQKARQKQLAEYKKLAKKTQEVKEKQSKPKKQKPQKCLDIQNGVLMGLGSFSEQILKIPEGITSIAENALKNANLTRVVIPNSVTSIGNNAFDGCALKSLIIGNGIKEIYENAFANCDNITRVSFKGTIEEWSEINFHNIVSNPSFWSKGLAINNKIVSTTSITKNTKPNPLAFLGWNAKINTGLM